MDYKQASDKELWQCCRQDDLRAYNALFQRYFRSLYAFAAKYTKDECAAEELAIDVMYRLWEKRTSIRDHSNLRAYLFTSVRRAVIDHWRKKEITATDIALVAPEHLPMTHTADADLERAEMEQLYQMSLAGLNSKEREVFLLSREQELTYAQIADHLGVSVNTVKTHMTSSLRTFRQLLAPHTDVLLGFICALAAYL